jgi:gamma-glutamylcyclotransferase (GGCT)/AIG2-like uncharacterized protein YtfP
MNYVFVYGTLKKHGSNHKLLEKSKFIKNHILEHCQLCDYGHGFPYLIHSAGYYVHGEVYEVDDRILSRLDQLEGVPHLYMRRLSNFDYNGTTHIGGLSYYLSHFNGVEPQFIVPNGYWETNDKLVKLKVVIDNRVYEDIAEKLVFHMRFFDGGRTPTNKSYMELVKARSHKPINSEKESIFIRDCIAFGLVDEITEGA